MEPERSLSRDTNFSFPPNVDQKSSFQNQHEQQQYEQELHERYIQQEFLKEQELLSRRPSQQELDNLLTGTNINTCKCNMYILHIYLYV
jgi:hypothetical protein